MNPVNFLAFKVFIMKFVNQKSRLCKINLTRKLINLLTIFDQTYQC